MVDAVAVIDVRWCFHPMGRPTLWSFGRMQQPTTAGGFKPNRGFTASVFAFAVMLFLCAHASAWAEAYKCKQPNGSLSFQDHPCASDAPGSAVSLPPLNNGATEAYGTSQKPARTSESQQNKQVSAEQRANDEKVKAINEQAIAHNRNVICNQARRQLEVLKTPVRAFRRDSNGEKQYVSDDNRPAEIAAAQKRVNEACN